jgi:hypothetical protein
MIGDRRLADIETGSSRSPIGVLVIAEATQADLRFGVRIEPHCVIDSLDALLPEGFPFREAQGRVLYEEELE